MIAPLPKDDLPALSDLVVVGAGPAGMAAATTAAAAGLGVVVLDENPAAGGQIWRGIARAPAGRAQMMGPDYQAGLGHVQAFAASAARHVPGAAVWGMNRSATGLDIGVVLGGRAARISARTVILATGAMERPMPLPGWTLPGVMTAGAAQIALKTAGMVPERRTVLAGTGPLLYLLAAQLARAGAAPVALVETRSRGAFLAAWRHAPGFLASGLAIKGLGLWREMRAAVPVLRAEPGLSVTGQDRATGLRWQGGAIAADLVLLHDGVVPVTNLTVAAGCEMIWDARQHCFRPRLDAMGQSTVPGLFVAGDGAGIGGAAAAVLAGQQAALAVLALLGRGGGDGARAVRPALAAARRGRAFVDQAFAPRDASRIADDTVVCRCEAITAGQIRAAARLGAPGPNQIKTFLRCGMGACQGRQCGLALSALIADTQARPIAETGALRTRAPVKPLRLGALAALPAAPEAWQAVTGTVLQKERTDDPET